MLYNTFLSYARGNDEQFTCPTRGEMLGTLLSQHQLTDFPYASSCTPQSTSSENSLGGLASCDLVAGEDIDVESSGDRWALNKVRNELVYPRIFFVCVALSVLLTFPKAQGKDLVGLAIRHKEDLVHEPRLVFKDWEDPIVNGFGSSLTFPGLVLTATTRVNIAFLLLGSSEVSDTNLNSVASSVNSRK